MSLAPGATLGPYTIVSQLGSGGMGVVYQATDPRLKRTVAIKLLSPDLTRDETAKQRFLQEAQAASALDHPNICTIFEINETDDRQLYLVMAHYEGETLKERIARGPLDLSDAIDIATQVGEGLAKAHAAGIVHRDIKPANLMVTKDGTIKILDFGLAKLTGAEGVTQTATTVGTVAYMSPEQARGQQVDHRTDIWSLGVVLYEMLAGTPPFRGENLAAVVHAILERDQPSLGGVSSHAQGAVTRALSKDTAQRYQSVTDLLAQLRALQSGTDAATVAAPTKADVPSIAVLPFVNMSADPEQEYFCDGLAEELIDRLARLEGLRVVARTSAFQFRGQAPDLREVGDKLNVKTVLEGSVRKVGNRLRINAQLINAEDGYHLWSARYDRTMDDVFEVQDDVARAVAEQLKVALLIDKRVPLVPTSTANVESYTLYLKGHHLRDQVTEDGMTQALDLFDQALEVDPGFARAHAGRAWVYRGLATLGYRWPRDVVPKAIAAARQAIALDDTVGEAHSVLAIALHLHEYDWDGAAAAYHRALERDPGDTLGRGHYAFFLILLGDSETGIAGARRAVDLDPLSPFSGYFLAQALFIARRFDDTVAQARANVELSPSTHFAYWLLGLGLAATGAYQEAVDALEQGVAYAAGDFNNAKAFLGWVYALAGRPGDARRIAEECERRRHDHYFPASLIASIHVGLGSHDRAMDWLDSAYDEHDGLMSVIGSWAMYDPLRSDPRFQALLQRMHFPAGA